jgi:hypothetical protein
MSRLFWNKVQFFVVLALIGYVIGVAIDFMIAVFQHI